MGGIKEKGVRWKERYSEVEPRDESSPEKLKGCDNRKDAYVFFSRFICHHNLIKHFIHVLALLIWIICHPLALCFNNLNMSLVF